MPKVQQKGHLPRQIPVSCSLCRSRKLRCSREAPCSNCVSRGAQCDLEPKVEKSNGDTRFSEHEILERLERLESLMFTGETNRRDTSKHTSDKTSSNESDFRASFTHTSNFSTQVQGLNNDVAWLESIYTDPNLSRDKIRPNKLIFRICPLQKIPEKPLYLSQDVQEPTRSSEPSRCVWLPTYSEAQILLDEFLLHAIHLPHTIHAPSLPSIFEEVYTDLDQSSQVQPGKMILLLTIIAGATHTWGSNARGRELFSSPIEANKQTILWVEAALDVLNITNEATTISIEGIQATLILLFMIASLEGLSRRCRILHSTAVWLAKDLGIHYIDHPSSLYVANTAEAEVGRRVWWHLCFTDWTIAARFPSMNKGTYSCHLHQMMTEKPLNINDDEIFDGMSRTGRPLSEPTTMSYSLQRLFMADISRKMSELNPFAMTSSGISNYEKVLEIDTELQILIDHIPSFFHMSRTQISHKYHMRPTRAAEFVHQGHTLRFLLYTQQCKLHLAYLTRGFVDPAYHLSKQKCIRSAQLIIHSKSQLDSSDDKSAAQFELLALVVGVFMASIVLLMDLCVNKDINAPEYDDKRAEVTKAFRMLDESKNGSQMTVKFMDSLIQILRKHKVPPLLPKHIKRPLPARDEQSFRRSDDDENEVATYNVSSVQPTEIPTEATSLCALRGLQESSLPSSGPGGTTSIESSEDEQLFSSYFNEFIDSFEQRGDEELGNFEYWNNVFSGLDSSGI